MADGDGCRNGGKPVGIQIKTKVANQRNRGRHDHNQSRQDPLATINGKLDKADDQNRLGYRAQKQGRIASEEFRDQIGGKKPQRWQQRTIKISDERLTSPIVSCQN